MTLARQLSMRSEECDRITNVIEQLKYMTPTHTVLYACYLKAKCVAYNSM